ncbi:glycosyltransferase family 4 protein [Pseudarthrobacter sp. NPDC058196]|uniref:glycosyltransferase family 4 protein n=1 Tax=Pseudarthrobacter sp. NPDC058196 TaxID=3346376 RepID=UPI0036D87DCF
MKITQVLLSPRIGGAEALAASLESHWTAVDVSVSTVFLDEDTDSPRSRLKRISLLRRKLREQRPDIVLAHSAIPNIYARLAAPLPTPVITVLHSASDDFAARRARILERILLVRTAHVVAVSAWQQQKYIEYFGFADRVSIIPNGIRSDIRHRAQAREVPRSLVTVARIANQKNPSLWASVAELLHARNSPLSLTWWGPLPASADLRDLMAAFASVPSSGRFAGPTADVPWALETADAMFHPADREAHSIGVLEAAAAGLPIVCSRAVAATLAPGVVTVPYEDAEPKSAVDAILHLCDNWEELATAAVRGASEIAKEFSIQSCAQRYISLFEKVLHGDTNAAGTK